MRPSGRVADGFVPGIVERQRDLGEKYFDSYFAEPEATDLDPSSARLDLDK